MHDDRTPPPEKQGYLTLASFGLTESNLDDPHCAVELAPMSADLIWRLTYLMAGLRRAGSFSVHRPFPCEFCKRPVSCIRLADSDRLLMLDAVEEPELPGFWTANLFEPHKCEVAG